MRTVFDVFYTALFWTTWGASAVWLGAHAVLGDASMPTVILHAMAGYIWIGALVAVVLSLPGDGWVRTAVSVPVLLLALGVVAPGHLDQTQDGDGALRLVTANVLMVHPDPTRVIDDLVASDADIIVLQEVNPRWATILRAAPQLAPWTHRHIDPEEGSFGIAVFSRVPAVITTEDLAGVKLGRIDLTVNGEPLRIYDVHTLPPRDARYARVWTEQMAELADRARTSPVPTIFAGDFNATRHHPSYRTLTKAGLRDAHSIAGRASAKTWPNGVFPTPSLRLDHVLVGPDIRVHAVHEAPANGSDHLPIVVDLSLGSEPNMTWGSFSS